MKIGFLLYFVTVICVQSVVKGYSSGICPKEELQTCATASKKGKQLGEVCSEAEACDSAMTCSADLKCVCSVDYIEIGGSSCVKAPGWQEECVNRQCKAPITCGSNNRCVLCSSPFTAVANGCKLECEATKVPGKAACLEKVATVGGVCTESVQCTVAYSSCVDGKCACTPGTAANGDSECKPATSKCPNGAKPLEKDAAIQQCKALQCPIGSGTSKKFDDCPDGHRCQFPGWQITVGFCCPTEQPWCPVGEALAGKVCPAVAERPEQLCPSDTHYCFATSGGSYCCPKPCMNVPISGMSVVVSGVCHEQAAIGSPCTINEQCIDNAVCNEQKVCQCNAGFYEVVVPGGTQRICNKRCQGQQISVNSDCLDPVLPMGECTSSAQCVIDRTTCRDGKCVCPCDSVLYRGKCILEPTCPLGWSGSAATTVPPVQDNNGYFECGPFRFWGYNGCSALTELAYCYENQQMAYGGHCCPMPEPSCPGADASPVRGADGKAVSCSIKLQQTSSGGCAASQFCHDYVRTVTGMETGIDQGVCCFSRYLYRSPTTG